MNNDGNSAQGNTDTLFQQRLKPKSPDGEANGNIHFSQRAAVISIVGKNGVAADTVLIPLSSK